MRIIPALLATSVALVAPTAAKDFKAPNNPQVEGGIIRSDVDDRGVTIIAWAFNLSDKVVSVQLSCVAFDAKDRPLAEQTVFIFGYPGFGVKSASRSPPFSGLSRLA